jgi:hypothetical protein
MISSSILHNMEVINGMEKVGAKSFVFVTKTEGRDVTNCLQITCILSRNTRFVISN